MKCYEKSGSSVQLPSHHIPLPALPIPISYPSNLLSLTSIFLHSYLRISFHSLLLSRPHFLPLSSSSCLVLSHSTPLSASIWFLSLLLTLPKFSPIFFLSFSLPSLLLLSHFLPLLLCSSLSSLSFKFVFLLFSYPFLLLPSHLLPPSPHFSLHICQSQILFYYLNSLFCVFV